MSVRILYLIDGLGMGGAERGLVLSLLHLDRSRFEPEVAILGRDHTLAPELRKAGIPIHALDARRGPVALLSVPAVVRLIRRGRFDVVHSSLVWSSIVGNLAGRAARVKVVEHIVNVDPDDLHAQTQAVTVRWKTKFVAAVAAVVGRFTVDRYVSISRAATELARWSWLRDPRRVRVVPRGQDLDELAKRSAAKPDPPVTLGSGPCLLSVGRLYPQKGHQYLIQALPSILGRHPEAIALIAGEGPLRDSLVRQADELGVGDHVRLLGVRHDVPSLMARADVFVFPSLWEGLGNAVIEAAALGRAIVTTNIPVMTETFVDGESAILVAPAEAKALAEAIDGLLAPSTSSANEMGRRLGDAAAEIAHTRFEINAATRVLESVYDELFASP